MTKPQSSRLQHWTGLCKVWLSMQRNNLCYLPSEKRKYFPGNRKNKPAYCIYLTKSPPYPLAHLINFQPPKHPPSLLSQEKKKGHHSTELRPSLGMEKVNQTWPFAVEIQCSARRSLGPEVTTLLQERGKAPAADKLTLLVESDREDSYTAT